jgi:hypothetical protein
MKVFFELFFTIVFITTVGPGSVLGEPCAKNDGYYGQYDMEACLTCEINGNNMKLGNCCNAIYHHAKGRDDDNTWNDDINVGDQCILLGDTCDKTDNHNGSVCAPGLVCKTNKVCITDIKKFTPDDRLLDICYSCRRPGYVFPSGSLMEYYSSTPGGDDSNRHESFSTTASYVGLLGMVIGVTMIVLKTTKKHRRNYQYTEIAAAAAATVQV